MWPDTTNATAGLPAERAGHAPPPELLERRRMLDAAVVAGTWRTTGRSMSGLIDGVRVLRFLPAASSRGVVLHLHGGGFRLGCPEMIGPYAAALAARCAVEVVCPAYRLAPEHPFPAGLNDASAVLSALRRDSALPLILAGDSAGGGLAAALAALSAAGAAAVRGLVLISPWLDLTVSSEYFEANAASDPMFSRAAARAAADLYLQGFSPRHPLASPLFGQVACMPPTFIGMGTEEVLAGDGRSFHTALRAAGVATTLQAIAGMQHVAVTRGLALSGAAETFDAVANFIDARLRDDALNSFS
jgi:epsilon-lactone hydrolase